MNWLAILVVVFLSTLVPSSSSAVSRDTIDVVGGPDSVVWVVQLSDLHFSVFHPDRAADFRNLIGLALAMINPSLVLITGDLTDGKSKDLLTMKQNKDEWLEYLKVTEDVVRSSGLDKKIFYDLRGNHDNFGVPVVGGKFDFFNNYSVNGRLRRPGNVNSITLQNGEWKHLFVGFDSTMDVGIRGPTNLFGHPTDQLLTDLDTELSQWDSRSTKFVTKVTYGHFPLSFSAATESGMNLKDIFLKHSLSAYLCGHLHTRFGKNLKRHHILGHPMQKYFQMNMQQGDLKVYENRKDCSGEPVRIKEFWEWEMGDWRKSRSMRILAIDMGHVSFVDLNLAVGAVKTIILPTFPIDSRFMQRLSSYYDYECQHIDISSYDSIRALVFSENEILTVSAKIYDSRPGKFALVFDGTMQKHKGSKVRGELYSIPWNWRAFVDPSPDRFWLQIEAIDFSGRSTYSSLRPFSINGQTGKVNWSWNEFFVMGCQWASLYQPMLWSVLVFVFSFLLIPKAFLLSTNFTPKDFGLDFNINSLGIWLVKNVIWAPMELSKITTLWTGAFVYLLYLLLFPWFSGHVFTERGRIGRMSYNGWILNSHATVSSNPVGVPDVMVIVLPHLVFVVMPMIFILTAMVAEKSAYQMHYLSLAGKKEDDIKHESDINSKQKSSCSFFGFCKGRWARKLLLIACVAVIYKHWKSCRALTKAYEMNPFLHFPAYVFTVPILLAYAFYRTK